MRNIENEKPVETTRATIPRKPMEIHSAEYLKGYRDGVRDRQVAARPHSGGDGILGALLAIALLAGVGYFGYNYATTGRLLPAGTEFPTLTAPSPVPQP